MTGLSVVASSVGVVDLTPGYGLPQSTVQRLQLLDWIFDQAGGKPMSDVHYGALAETDGYDYGTLEGFLQSFEQEGWVHATRALGTGTHVFLLQAGVDFVNHVHNERSNIPARRRAVRDALLRWLYDQNANGIEWAYINQFMESPFGYYYGEQFPEREVAQATSWLKENGYLRGQGSSWGGVPRPGITAQGETLVDSGSSVNASIKPADDVPPPVAMNITNNISGGTNNIANASPGAQQGMSVSTESRQQMAQVADALDGALDGLGLDADNTRAAQEVSRELRSASLVPEPDHGRLRALLAKISEVAVSGTGTALGSAIAALATQAASGLG